MKKSVVISAVLVGITAIGASAFASSTLTAKIGNHFGRGQAMSGVTLKQHTMSGFTMSGRTMPKFEAFAFSGITDAEKATLTALRDAEKAEREATAKLSDTDKAELKTLRETQQKEMQALREKHQTAIRALLTTKGVPVVSSDLEAQAKAIMEKYKSAGKDGK